MTFQIIKLMKQNILKKCLKNITVLLLSIISKQNFWHLVKYFLKLMLPFCVLKSAQKIRQKSFVFFFNFNILIYTSNRSQFEMHLKFMNLNLCEILMYSTVWSFCYRWIFLSILEYYELCFKSYGLAWYKHFLSLFFHWNDHDLKFDVLIFFLLAFPWRGT